MPSAGRPCARQQRHPPSKRTFALSDRRPPPLFLLTNLNPVSSLHPLGSAFRLSYSCYLLVSFSRAPFSPILFGQVAPPSFSTSTNEKVENTQVSTRTLEFTPLERRKTPWLCTHNQARARSQLRFDDGPVHYNGLYLVLGPDASGASQANTWSAATSADNGTSWAVAEVAGLELPPFVGMEVVLDYRTLWPW